MKNDLVSILTIGSYIIGFLGVGGAAFSFFRYNNYQTTVKLQNDSIEALKTNNEILSAELEKTRENARREHAESMKAIGVLEGRIQSYKEIPLKNIALSLEKISDSNGKILESLTTSATIVKEASHDGGLLVKTKETSPLDVKVKE